MQQHILTDFTIPVKVEEFDGEITLLEAKFWPDWETPKFHHLFSYTRSGKPVIVPVIDGKRYTFDDIIHTVNEHLNFFSVNEHPNVTHQVALLYHNNGRVTWKISTKQADEAKLSDIRLSSGLIDMLKLEKIDKDFFHMVSEPIDKSSINFCFSNASTIFFTCDECDKTTLVNNKKTNAVVAMPVVAGIDGAIKASLPASLTFSDNYTNQLNFHIQDEYGNNLLADKVFVRLTINERLQYRENLPRDSNSTIRR